MSGFAPSDAPARRLAYQRDLATKALVQEKARTRFLDTYQKYAHLDVCLSDPEWGDGSLQWHILHDLWQAAKALANVMEPVPDPLADASMQHQKGDDAPRTTDETIIE